MSVTAILLFIECILHAYSLNCITLQSAISGATSNEITSISCPVPYTLVSCGFKTDVIADKQPRGSWIINQTCYAMNGGGSNSNGVYALARCCQSNHSLICNTYASEFSARNDDAKINVTCQQSVETLLGCTAHGGAGDLVDGAFAGTFPDNGNKGNPASGTYYSYGNTCSGWMSTTNSNGIRSFGTCCEAATVAFDCLAIVSDQSVSGQGATVSIPCPQEHFMTSCTATSPWHEQNQWFVTNNSECFVRTGGGNVGLKAHAICCKEITVSPTYVPTFEPTFIPTIQPTSIPTIYPTSIPTINPTSIPTINPTKFPSKTPTKFPTVYPSKIPTKYPSKTPTKFPTFYPSKIPTQLPTPSPVNSGEIDISTTDMHNNNKQSNQSTQSTDTFMIQLFIFIVVGLAVVVIILCVIICFKRKRHKQAVSINTLVTSVSSNTTNINVDTGENEMVNNLQTTAAMTVVPNNFTEGDTEMISIPPNNTNEIEHESDGSESAGMYNKNVNTANDMNITPGNNGTDGYFISNPTNDINDINLMDNDNEYVDNNESDTEDNDQLYKASDVTTKGDQ